MADQQTRTSGTTHNAVISLLLPCLLIGNFLWCVLTPAHEYQMRTDQMLTMGLDLLGLLGVIGLRVGEQFQLDVVGVAKNQDGGTGDGIGGGGTPCDRRRPVTRTHRLVGTRARPRTRPRWRRGR